MIVLEFGARLNGDLITEQGNVPKVTKRALGSDLAKVDAYENTAADYEEIPEVDDAFIEQARREGRIRVDFPASLTLDDPILVGRLRGLGLDWQTRAREALKAWVDNGFVVVGVPNPFAARTLTKQQAADYCCAGSLRRLDHWRRCGMIPNQVPGTNLFDRHAIDLAIDKCLGSRAAERSQRRRSKRTLWRNGRKLAKRVARKKRQFSRAKH